MLSLEYIFINSLLQPNPVQIQIILRLIIIIDTNIFDVPFYPKSTLREIGGKIQQVIPDFLDILG